MQAFEDGSFQTDAAHEAEKAERLAIRDEKDAKDRANREAFQGMLLNNRVQRIAHVLSNVRLLEGVCQEALEEMASRCAANNVHTNTVCGFAKEETALHAGSQVMGLYFVAKGRVQFCRGGKVMYDGLTLLSGQYFGEPTLCTGSEVLASCDVVCKDYVDMYLLSKDDLLEVADMYDGTMDLLHRNRSNALKVQWHECKPYRSYELANYTPAVVRRERIVDTEEPPITFLPPGQTYPLEWYGKNELARSVPESSEEADEINPDGVTGHMQAEYKEAWDRVQENKRQVREMRLHAIYIYIYIIFIYRLKAGMYVCMYIYILPACLKTACRTALTLPIVRPLSHRRLLRRA